MLSSSHLAVKNRAVRAHVHARVSAYTCDAYAGTYISEKLPTYRARPDQTRPDTLLLHALRLHAATLLHDIYIYIYIYICTHVYIPPRPTERPENIIHQHVVLETTK